MEAIVCVHLQPKSWHNVMFVVLQYAASGYAMLHGGRPERYAGIGLLCAFWSTIVWRDVGLGFMRFDSAVMAIDAGLLAVIVAIAVRADRRWPLMLAVFQTLTVMSHLTRLSGGFVGARTYMALTVFWSFPMTIVLIVGTWRHRARERLSGPERDWSRR